MGLFLTGLFLAGMLPANQPPQRKRRLCRSSKRLGKPRRRKPVHRKPCCRRLRCRRLRCRRLRYRRLRCRQPKRLITANSPGRRRFMNRCRRRRRWPPDALRPWYYREWFLVPTFVWWPSSAILLLRSPWHNGVVMGTLSWFWLIVGGMWIFLRVRSSGTLVDETLWALAAPGLLLTIITQSLWLLRHRPRIRRIREAGGFADYADPPDDELSRRAIRPEPAASRRRANRGHTRSRRRRR